MTEITAEEMEKMKKLEQLKKIVRSRVLTKDAIERLGRLRMVKPEVAEQIELFIIQLYQQGQIKSMIDDKQLKEISLDGFPMPAFAKPAYEGSSKGIRHGSRAETTAQITEIAAELLEHYKQPVMIEEFIAGDEVTVSVLGNSPAKVLGIMRVIAKKKSASFVYSLEVKREWEQLVDYECPALLETNILDEIAGSSLEVFKVLGCRVFARLDVKLSPERVPYFLEINPLAGLNPKSSDLVIMSYKLGWTYQALISAIFNAALQRYPQCVKG